VNDHEDEIGQALINVSRKDIVVVKQVGGVQDAGRVGLHGALVLAGLIHVTLLGCIVDLDMTMNALSSETREPFHITFIDRIGQCRDDRQKKASMIEMRQLLRIVATKKTVCNSRGLRGGDIVIDLQVGRPAIINDANVPEAMFGVMPTSEDDFAVRLCRQKLLLNWCC
jgi:hypothetical protein